jgi:hypothetical protein
MVNSSVCELVGNVEVSGRSKQTISASYGARGSGTTKEGLQRGWINGRFFLPMQATASLFAANGGRIIFCDCLYNEEYLKLEF